MQSDLKMGLLLEIMKRMSKLRATYPQLISTQDFLDLTAEFARQDNELDQFYYLDRHLTFLIQEDYLERVGGKTLGGDQVIKLTSKGEMFVQPSLVEFGKEALLPQVVKSIENQIEVLTYPQEEKDGMRYRLHEALAKQAPDFIAKAIAEIAIRAYTASQK